MFRLLTILGLLVIATLECIPAVYITEIYPQRNTTRLNEEATSEFIEIFNSSDTIANLKDWVLLYGEESYNFSEDDVIEPQNTLVLFFASQNEGERGSDFFNYFSDKEDCLIKNTTIRFSTNKTLSLRDNLGNEKDYIDWSDWAERIKKSEFKHPSLHRDSIKLGCNDSTLSTNIKIAPPTPGKIESLYEKNEASLWVEIDKDSTNVLRMHFVTLQIENKGEELTESIESNSNSYDIGEIPHSFYELVRLHPNPVNTYLQVTSLSTQTADCHYVLQNESGVVLKRGVLDEEGDGLIDMVGLAKGNYVLSIEKDGCRYPFKVEKE
ncbi:MAG: lamin tail domain-containing protein [Paludibacteraceae bacterium]|nr:lamin tail domain-containing protein [Paludibacteraceae bacterium]